MTIDNWLAEYRNYDICRHTDCTNIKGCEECKYNSAYDLHDLVEEAKNIFLKIKERK